MPKNIIWDLDDVLIHDRTLNPQAHEALMRSNKDFDKTLLWTMTKLEDSTEILKKHGILHYFNSIIGYENDIKNKRINDVIMDLVQGAETNKRILCERNWKRPKNLTKLPGSAKDYVIIDNDKKFVYPTDRWVFCAYGAYDYIDGEIQSVQFDLIEAYEKALKLF